MTNILNVINSNVDFAIKATENSFRGKVFVVVEGDRICSFNKTKRGAEGYIKKNTFSYYDDYTQDMVQVGSNSNIVEVCALDIVDYFNTKEIWFETILSKWKINQSNDYTLKQAKEMGCHPEIIAFIENVIANMDANSFPSREMVGLECATEVVEVSEEVFPVEVETVQNEIVEATQSEITFKLNEEKNGVEIYFNNKPSEEVRGSLKANGFRWSKFSKAWYAKQSVETIEYAEKLANGNVSNDVSEILEIEVSEFVDISQYIVNESTEKRLIDTSLFGDMRKVGYETNSLQNTLLQLLNETKEVVDSSDSVYHKNKLINGFNSFCERYTKELNNYLYTKSINPGWAVTGRGGINVNKYNKKQEQITNKMLKVVEMLDDQKSYLNKYKNKLKSEFIKKQKEEIQSTVNSLDGKVINFKTEKRKFEYYGYTYDTRSYVSDNYFIMKLAGCFRIFENATGKEVHSLKTTGNLDAAKLHVTYLEIQLIKNPA